MLQPYSHQRPERPAPGLGTAEHRRLASLQHANPWFTVTGCGWARGWTRDRGDVGRTPGWVIPTSLN